MHASESQSRDECQAESANHENGSLDMKFLDLKSRSYAFKVIGPWLVATAVSVNDINTTGSSVTRIYLLRPITAVVHVKCSILTRKLHLILV